MKWHCIVGMTHACAEVGAVADMQERGGGDPNRGARPRPNHVVVMMDAVVYW